MGQHTGFWFGLDVDVLFSGWPSGHGAFHYCLALILAFLLSMLAQMVAMTPVNTPKKIGPKNLVKHAVLHCLRILIKHLVLLCVVTFNLGVVFTVLIGHVAGYVALTLYIHYNLEAPVAAAPADDDAKA